MRRLADYTVGLVIVLGHLVWMSLQDQRAMRRIVSAR
jgi:hypothetical protein